MKILLTGATGFIGSKLLPILLEEEYQVFALVRDRKKLKISSPHLKILEGDLLKPKTLNTIPSDIDVAFYLVHSMTHSASGFDQLESEAAENFVRSLKKVRQVIYLSGLMSEEYLSKHLRSRKKVEDILIGSKIPYTIFRSGIVMGSGSASFEILRDLVEKLPVMVAPKWVDNQVQPISVDDVLFYLKHAVGNSKCFNHSFDIGIDKAMTYKELLLWFAKFRGLKRWIISIPVLTPRLSSYWLYLITSTNFSLAMSLVDSLKSNSICQHDRVDTVLPHQLLSLDQAMKQDFIGVPSYGCLIDLREFSIEKREQTLEKLWKIGGDQGWYAFDWAWWLRKAIDKFIGGVGFRGRIDVNEIYKGDHIDFWRVLDVDKKEGKLLLYAEMKLPGEAWLEFHVRETILSQRAIFRPKGLLGRFYWYFLYPIHALIFQAMGRYLGKPDKRCNNFVHNVLDRFFSKHS